MPRVDDRQRAASAEDGCGLLEADLAWHPVKRRERDDDVESGRLRLPRLEGGVHDADVLEPGQPLGGETGQGIRRAPRRRPRIPARQAARSPGRCRSRSRRPASLARGPPGTARSSNNCSGTTAAPGRTALHRGRTSTEARSRPSSVIAGDATLTRQPSSEPGRRAASARAARATRTSAVLDLGRERLPALLDSAIELALVPVVLRLFQEARVVVADVGE